MSTPFLAVIVAAEVVALWYLQRRVSPRIMGRRGALLLLAPATVAHEAAHWIMAVLLRVPCGRAVGGHVRLFAPRREPDGSMVLGYVDVARTDPLRGALISIAPALLVPILFLGASWALIGTGNPAEFATALTTSPWWAIVLWLVLALTLPLAAFPSVGDYIGVLGGASLILAAAVAIAALHALAGPAGITQALEAIALIFAPPALLALVLVTVRGVARR